MSTRRLASGRHPNQSGYDEYLEEAIEMGRLTEGGFNILIGPAVEAWSLLDRQEIPSELALQAVHSLMDLRSLHLNTSQGTVY